MHSKPYVYADFQYQKKLDLNLGFLKLVCFVVSALYWFYEL